MKVSTADITPAHTCHVTGVRYSRTDSAVPYTVTAYSAYFIRTTARVSFAVGNPGNLGCGHYRTETAVELGRAAHGWLLGRYSALAVGTYSLCYPPITFTNHSLLANCFVALSLGSELCRQHFLGLLSFTLNSSFINMIYFDSVTSTLLAEEQNRRNREMNLYT